MSVSKSFDVVAVPTGFVVPTNMPSDNIQDFRRVLRASKRILVVSGAGLSAASGIPTFRGNGGMWRKYDAISLATPEAFAENQSRVWQFYHYRREVVLKADPNPAHYVLARLAFPKVRQSVAPDSQFTHVTQNVDGLLTRALKEVETSYGTSESPSELIEMHGRLFDVICTAHDCSFHETNYQSPICPALAGTERIVEDGVTDPVVNRADLPHCPLCGQLCRPGVVWFGEVPHRMDDIFNLADTADLCIVVGTSATVQPAASLGEQVKDNGGQVAVFNIEAGDDAEDADFIFLGPCEETLGRVFNV